MPIIKEFREFFLRHTTVTTGTKPDQEASYPLQYLVNGVPKFNRFLKGDYPSESIMKKFLESIPFHLNPESTATETQQGLIELATDIEAINRSNPSNSRQQAVLPHQIPMFLSNTGDVRITENANTYSGRIRKEVNWTTASRPVAYADNVVYGTPDVITGFTRFIPKSWIGVSNGSLSSTPVSTEYAWYFIGDILQNFKTLTLNGAGSGFVTMYNNASFIQKKVMNIGDIVEVEIGYVLDGLTNTKRFKITLGGNLLYNLSTATFALARQIYINLKIEKISNTSLTYTTEVKYIDTGLLVVGNTYDNNYPTNVITVSTMATNDTALLLEVDGVNTDDITLNKVLATLKRI